MKMKWIAGLRRAVIFSAMFSSILTTQTTSAAAQSASPPGASRTPHASISPQTAALERDFFAALRQANATKFLSYVPEEGLHVGPQAQPLSRAEVEEQLSHRRGLYCKLFNSSCIDTAIKLDTSSRSCSDRELLTRSEKVLSTARETAGNGVLQPLLAPQV